MKDLRIFSLAFRFYVSFRFRGVIKFAIFDCSSKRKKERFPRISPHISAIFGIPASKTREIPEENYPDRRRNLHTHLLFAFFNSFFHVPPFPCLTSGTSATLGCLSFKNLSTHRPFLRVNIVSWRNMFTLPPKQLV